MNVRRLQKVYEIGKTCCLAFTNDFDHLKSIQYVLESHECVIYKPIMPPDYINIPHYCPMQLFSTSEFSGNTSSKAAPRPLRAPDTLRVFPLLLRSAADPHNTLIGRLDENDRRPPRQSLRLQPSITHADDARRRRRPRAFLQRKRVRRPSSSGGGVVRVNKKGC